MQSSYKYLSVTTHFRTNHGLTGSLGTLAVLLLASTTGCEVEGPRGHGKLRIELSAEETITDGLALGSENEDARDYAVHFTKYLATLGNVRVARDDGHEARLPGVFVADMVQVGEAGVELGELTDLRAGQWPEFGFETPVAKLGAKALAGVSKEDLALMIERGLTYWIEGVVERSDEQGGPVSFVVQTAVPTVFSRCEHDGEFGVAIVADGTSTATITLHGDHMFFNRFPTGAESDMLRLAGWVVAADTDGDGKVRTEDLAALDPTVVFTRALGYSLGGASHPIQNALDFVRLQLATQGHFAGEGECISDFRGTLSP
jgi:hypothetical protein